MSLFGKFTDMSKSNAPDSGSNERFGLERERARWGPPLNGFEKWIQRLLATVQQRHRGQNQAGPIHDPQEGRRRNNISVLRRRDDV